MLMLQVSQLLQKLRTDLHLSFHSFLKEFVAEPNDGVGFSSLKNTECVVFRLFILILDLLKMTTSDIWQKCCWVLLKKRLNDQGEIKMVNYTTFQDGDSKIKVVSCRYLFKVTLLLDLLKMIQLSQTNSNSNKQSSEDSGHRQQVL